MKTYAFAHVDYPTEVRLWCRRRLKGPSLFRVINGEWNLNSTVDDDYRLIWEGEVPEAFSQHYSDAIKWIQEQVDG